LSEYINLLEHEKVDLLSDGPNLRVKGATSETTMRGMPPEDFPIIPAVSKEQTISVPSQEFRDALVQVLFAAAQDTSRPEISGMFLSATPTSLTLAATDSYRLAERALGINAGFVRTAIIPTRPLHEIVRIVSGEGSVEIALSDTQALFTLEGTEVTSRLIEGRYPDYRQIIPTTARTSATVQVEQLVKLIRTASLFCKPGINDVTIELSPKSGTITCSAANAELGEHRGSLKADVTGSENTVVFNYRYFLDGLANIATASAMIQVTDSAGPGVVRPTDGKEYLYLIMPIRQ
jgi:DNA polymerase-3 subunit beta